MDDRRALMAAIIASPDEDTPRLALADWLQEHGDEHDRARAEFIRLHIRWCRRNPNSPGEEALRSELLSLWNGCGLRDEKFCGGLDHVYDRGLIAGVRFDGDAPAREQIELAFPQAPIRVIDLWPLGNASVEYLARSPRLAQLRGLSLGDNVELAEQFLSFEALGNLELLHLAGSYPEEAARLTNRLAAAGYLKRLTVLDLEACHIGDEGLATLSNAPQFATVRKLVLNSDNRGTHHVAEAGVRAFTTSRTFTAVTHLGFNECAIDAAALQHLLSWAGAGGLLELDLCFNHVGGGDVVALARSRKLSNLRRLALVASSLTDEAVRALKSARFLGTLEQLWIIAPEDYGTYEDQSPEILSELAHALDSRLVMRRANEWGFQLSAVGEADRIWRRLYPLQWRDEALRESTMIL